MTGSHGPERSVCMEMDPEYSTVPDLKKSKTIIQHKYVCLSHKRSSHSDLCIHSSSAAFQMGAAVGPCQAYRLMKERWWPEEQRRLRDGDSAVIMSPRDK